MKNVYGSPKSNAGRMPRQAPIKCFNCGTNCVRGEFELDFWNGYDRCYEAETVCHDCHVKHFVTQWMP